MKMKSQLFEKGNGSIGGLTGGQDRGGQYLRKKISRKKKPTAYQKSLTDHYSNGNKLFKTISPIYYKEWERYGLTLKRVNDFGAETSHTALQAFMRSYAFFAQAGIDTAILLKPSNLGKGFLPEAILALIYFKNDNQIILYTGINEFQRLGLFVSNDFPKTYKKCRSGYKFLTSIILTPRGFIQIKVPPIKGKRYLKIIHYSPTGAISDGDIFPLIERG